MKTQLKQASLALLLGMGVAFSAQAGPMDLTGMGYVTYGDGNSYSLPINALVYDSLNGGGVGPGNPFYVNSSPGQIADLVVLATGADGHPVNYNFLGMDNAYPTPSGVSGSTFFTTTDTYDPGTLGNGTPIGFTGDQLITWDTTLGALQGFLGSNDLIFFFNNNQINSGAATNQNLAAWAQITLTGPSGTLGIWDFTNNNSPYALVTEGGGGVFMGDPTAYTSDGSGPDAGTNANTDYVLAGGEICLTAAFIPVSCSSPHVYGPIEHNLGANQAAYGVVFPELNAALSGLFALPSLDGYAMHVDFRMGCDPDTAVPGTNCIARSLNDGYEQLFIATAVPQQQVPEPATLTLMGLGLLGLAWTIGSRRAAK